MVKSHCLSPNNYHLLNILKKLEATPAFFISLDAFPTDGRYPTSNYRFDNH